MQKNNDVEKAIHTPSETISSRENDSQSEEVTMTLLDHLRELRKRLIYIMIALLIGFLLSYGFVEYIFAFIVTPLKAALPESTKLIYTSLPEAFFVYLKIAFISGIFVTSPFLFYQLWAFIAPGLYQEEKRYGIILGTFSAFFFTGGAAFCYYQVFPVAFKFFLSFSNDLVEPLPSLSLFLSFALKLLLAFGFIAEIPLFAFFLARLGLISVKKMKQFRRYFIFIAFIAAAILTPPDIFSQSLMAIPMLVLYELSVIIVYFMERKKEKEKIHFTNTKESG
ncbi:MAG: twin-arginine translocase subunit TatC [Desulfovibrionaceae bacterium]